MNGLIKQIISDWNCRKNNSKNDRDNGIGGNENEVKRIIENFTR